MLLVIPLVALTICLHLVHRVPPVGAQPTCTISPPSQAISDLNPDIVGACIEDEHLNPETGLIEQRTSTGLHPLRPGDGLVSFANDTTIWLLGPDGPVSRALSDPPFAWESIPAALGVPPPAMATPTVGRIYFTVEDDGNRRAELDRATVPAASQSVYAFFDYADVVVPHTLRSCFLFNGQPQPCSSVPMPPPDPTGFQRRQANFSNGLQAGQVLTLVVELDGQEVARKDVRAQ